MSRTIDESPILPPEAMQHYQQVEEAARLTRVGSQIELIRTQELLSRYLPPPPAVVYDVGGGAGIYAFWLAERGYTVHLLDAVPRHIDQAREAAQTKPDAPLAGMAVGDARQLEYADATAEGVLLFGPLYHLTEQADRLQALREAYRVLCAGGVVMAVGISRFTSTINGLLEGAITDPLFRPIMERDLLDGQHRNPTNDPAYFTTTFFHHPDELLAEVAAAGFEGRIRLAIEGPARLLKAFQTGWQDEAQRAWLLRLVQQLEEEPSLLGVSTHIMVIGYKP
jgi:ubiquinone/menaquinone biosynthesis C-methylase UbiE